MRESLRKCLGIHSKSFSLWKSTGNVYKLIIFALTGAISNRWSMECIENLPLEMHSALFDEFHVNTLNSNIAQCYEKRMLIESRCLLVYKAESGLCL